MITFCQHCGQPIPNFNGIKTIPDRLEIHFQGKSTKLTPREFSIWVLLMEKPGAHVYRTKIIELVYDPNGESSSDNMTVDVIVHRLRKKLKAVGLGLASEPGLGWRVEEPNNE